MVGTNATTPQEWKDATRASYIRYVRNVPSAGSASLRRPCAVLRYARSTYFSTAIADAVGSGAVSVAHRGRQVRRPGDRETLP